ncbi:nucleotidyltransferase substrate binding protein [Natribacillus halophilus]|uniref:Nucleotidyltransferase substrate binding protein, HI0074 family n=1 Tax=Natribacillus halophilus TaxID=549003 RepID=A0A1G8Q2H1_9BACI|nr:nucleotidyltransferase substrate binding protein [Natribacillus halophilus]SDI98726.1 nucleotidyltransferase substrate binding protein, HI0074 family [Natribacillus halophilus]
MNQKNIRWRQRFENFERAYNQLSEAVTRLENLSTLEKEGLIQRFEYTFELAWKTVKDYLEAQDVAAGYPREVIKSAFYYGLIKDGETWMDMLEKRHLMAHTYNEARFNNLIDKIKDEYYDALTQVYRDLSEQI